MDKITNGASTPVNSGVYIYPGSFDPVTFGHLDIIERASGICGRLIIAVGQNRDKRSMFTVGERMQMLGDVIKGIRPNTMERIRPDGGRGPADIEITSFDGLLIDFAKKHGASVIVKGLRAMSDFEYEFQMALMNKYLDGSIETIFMMTNVQYTYLSSRAVKEIAINGGRLDGLVPECVIERIQKKAHNGASM